MSWDIAQRFCADILKKMIGAAPVLCASNAERRAKDRWVGVMDMCEEYICLINTIESTVLTVKDLTLIVANSVVAYDASFRHEKELHGKGDE